MYYNDNGFLSLHSFDSLGFSSISIIKNFEACSKYILKYINKDMCKAFKGEHLYFCSRSLKRSETFMSFYASDIQPLRYNFKNQFINKTFISYYNFYLYLDMLLANGKIYSVIKDDYKLLLP